MSTLRTLMTRLSCARAAITLWMFLARSRSLVYTRSARSTAFNSLHMLVVPGPRVDRKGGHRDGRGCTRGTSYKLFVSNLMKRNLCFLPCLTPGPPKEARVERKGAPGSAGNGQGFFFFCVCVCVCVFSRYFPHPFIYVL